MHVAQTKWDAHRFSNSHVDTSIVFEEDEEVHQLAGESFYTGVPTYGEDYGYTFDPRLHRIGGPVMDTVVNPVENLSNRLPMPTLASPVESLNIGRAAGADPYFGEAPAGGMDPQSADATCCGSYIGHTELRQTRENLGMNQAQRGRFGRGAGEGESLQSTDQRLSGTQGRHGPVAITDSLYTAELYDQGFVSMGAVPSVFVGVYTDPITGEEFDAYESGLPPPDTDNEESLNASGRNVKLAHLQGGWRDTTPRPTKVEVLEDDFHMQYDRSINTYGTYDPSYYLEVIEHNNRFKRDDHHPDPEGPIQVGTPANTFGNQGDVKIRPTPYIVPTNRGKWVETTFRTGIDASTEGAGGGDLRLNNEYTKSPYVRAESNRMDGGGAEAGGAYGGFMNQYGGSEGYDHHATQRSANEHRAPNMGPIGDGSAHGLSVYGDVDAPMGNAGTHDVGMYGLGPVTGEHSAAALQNQMVSAPNRQAGLATTEQMFGGTQSAHNAVQLTNQTVVNMTSKSGVVNENVTWGSRGETGHANQGDGGLRTAMDKTKRQQVRKIQGAFDTALGNYTAHTSHATRTRFNDKSDHFVDFLMPSATLGGMESVASGAEARGVNTGLGTKRNTLYDTQRGVNGAAANAPDATVWYGNYRETNMELLSQRPLGSVFENTNAGAGMALGFRETREIVGR